MTGGLPGCYPEVSWCYIKINHIQQQFYPSPPTSEIQPNPSQAARAAHQRKGFCPSILLLWDPIWSRVHSSGVPSARKTWNCWRKSRRGYDIDKRMESPFLWSKWGNLGLLSLEKKRLCGKSLGLSHNGIIV